MTGRRGAALVEFALMALALYILVFGGIELGRMIFISGVIQDAARVAARELAVTPLPAGYTFDCTDPGPNTCVLNDQTVLTNIWNPNLLVIDTSTCYNTDDKLNTYWNSLPLVNRALRPAFISETLNPGQTGERRLLRFPGALQPSGRMGPPHTMVQIPRIPATLRSLSISYWQTEVWIRIRFQC